MDLNLVFNYKNIATISIEIPEKIYIFLKDDNVFQSIIIETILDYIEKKEDLETKNKLVSNIYFHNLNSKLEEKLN